MEDLGEIFPTHFISFESLWMRRSQAEAHRQMRCMLYLLWSVVLGTGSLRRHLCFRHRWESSSTIISLRQWFFRPCSVLSSLAKKSRCPIQVFHPGPALSGKCHQPEPSKRTCPERHRAWALEHSLVWVKKVGSQELKVFVHPDSSAILPLDIHRKRLTSTGRHKLMLLMLIFWLTNGAMVLQYFGHLWIYSTHTAKLV